VQNSSEFQYIAIDTIHESATNPRRTFDEAKLQELAESIRTNGLIQPITVRPNSKGFEVVSRCTTLPRIAAGRNVFHTRTHRGDQRCSDPRVATGGGLAARRRTPVRRGAGLPALSIRRALVLSRQMSMDESDRVRDIKPHLQAAAGDLVISVESAQPSPQTS
jgi:hypothetical protein